MDRLAQHGRLLRHYTQNVDCIEQQLPALDMTTVQLHGRIDQALCHQCGWKGPFVPSWFVGPELPSCSHCYFWIFALASRLPECADPSFLPRIGFGKWESVQELHEVPESYLFIPQGHDGFSMSACFA